MNINRSGYLIKTDAGNLPLVNHFAITLFLNNKLYVLENTPFYGSRIITFDKFMKGRTIEFVKPTKLINKSNKYIFDKFNNLCQKPYDLINYNCEHFIDCMMSDSQKSEQLHTIAYIGLAGFILYKVI